MATISTKKNDEINRLEEIKNCHIREEKRRVAMMMH
jgi:hypothetical protein